MNDIYSTMHSLTADLIQTAYPAEDEGKISPVSLKCEITRGNVTYYVTNKRNSKGNYESDIRADTKEELEKAKDIDFVPDREINLATARLIREALSDPDTLENIKDGTITTKALINSILSSLELEGITSPADMAIKTLQMSHKETANQRNAENKAIEEVNEIMSAKKRIVEAVEAAAADTANADNCIADYHFSVEAADEDGKNIKKLSIVFEN